MPVIYFSGATPIRTERSSNLGPGTIFSLLKTCLDRIWGPPSPHFNGYQGYPSGINRQERDIYRSPPSSVEVESNGAITPLLISDFTACTGRLYFYHLLHNSPEEVAENDEKLQPGLL